MNPVLVQTTIATAAAYLGGALGAASGQLMSRHLRAAILISMAVLLSVTIFDILPDAYRSLVPWQFVAAVASGFFLFWLVSHFVGPLCPACVSGDGHSPSHAAPLYIMLLLVAMHSTFDGIALAISGTINGKIDLVVLSGICVHKIPEGIALALLMIGSGFKPSRALISVLAVEFTTEIGGVLGLLLIHIASPSVLGMVFAHVGGGFIFLIGAAVISNLKAPGSAIGSIRKHTDAI